MIKSIRLKMIVWTAVILFLFGAGVCSDDDSTTFFKLPWGKSSEETDVFNGTWYAVMSTACNDDGPCNIFTNNVGPCACLSALFLPLQDEAGWLVFMSATNNKTHSLTVDMGGVSATSTDNKNIKGFVLSRAVMPTSVIAVSDKYITERVSGSGCFIRYEMSVIGNGIDFFYIVTTLKTESGPEIIVIWSRNRSPGKKATWTQILGSLSELSINPHDLNFISQENCNYPSIEQCNEMFFCVN